MPYNNLLSLGCPDGKISLVDILQRYVFHLPPTLIVTALKVLRLTLMSYSAYTDVSSFGEGLPANTPTKVNANYARFQLASRLRIILC